MPDPNNSNAQAQAEAGAAGGEGSGQGGQDQLDQNQVAARAAAATAAQAKAESGEGAGKWYEAFPTEAQEKLKGFASMEDAVAAIEKGAEFVQAKSIEDYKIDLGEKLNGQPDGGALDRFKEFCLKDGINPKHAQSLVSFQLAQLEEAQQQAIEIGTSQLKKTWGNNYPVNCEKSLVALTALDRRMGGRLAPALGVDGSGKINDPVVMEALFEVSKFISEDSLGAGGPGGVAPTGPISTVDAYTELFNKAKTQ